MAVRVAVLMPVPMTVIVIAGRTVIVAVRMRILHE
jgi:hypothetical protein